MDVKFSGSASFISRAPDFHFSEVQKSLQIDIFIKHEQFNDSDHKLVIQNISYIGKVSK